jgi:hypothetical protein
MNNDDFKDEKKASTEGCSPCEKGTGNLLLGAGVGTYGTVTFVTTGVVCPACIILTPALLGYGAYKRMKFNRKKKPTSPS